MTVETLSAESNIAAGDVISSDISGTNESAATDEVHPDKEVSSTTEPLTLPRELTMRHPLQSRWVLWYLKADRQKHWEECLKEVATFDSVEDFWALYNHIQSAFGLAFGCDYYLFKELRNALLDQYWLELLMSMVGEQFHDYGEYICGAVVNVSLWTRNAELDEVNLRIGQILKAKLRVPDSECLRYEVHKDSQKRTSSTVKPRIMIPGQREKSQQNGTSEKAPAAVVSS